MPPLCQTEGVQRGIPSLPNACIVNLETKDQPVLVASLNTRPQPCVRVGTGLFRIVSSRRKNRAGDFLSPSELRTQVATRAELDGKLCQLNDWLGRTRKTTQRLGAGALSGRSGEPLFGITARAGVASGREVATTVGMSLSGHGFTGRPQPSQQRQPDTGLKSPVLREPHGSLSLCRVVLATEHRSLINGGVVPVSSHCPRLSESVSASAQQQYQHSTSTVHSYQASPKQICK